MQALSRSEPRPVRAALLAAIGLIALAGALATRADAGVAPGGCPTFRVLHADRIGPASFPAGSYELKVESGLNCGAAAELFARFLADYDGVLPKPWTLVAEGSGKASFNYRKTVPAISVALVGKPKGGGMNPAVGRLCPGTFMVESSTVVGPLRFSKGKVLIYLPRGSRLTCKGASALFTQFLGAGGRLPSPWRLLNQTATFYRPGDTQGSAFRVEPLAGSTRP